MLLLPKGVFSKTPATTAVLFFKKGSASNKIWFYKLQTQKNLGLNNPLTSDDMQDFVDNFKSQPITDNSWIVDVDKLNQETFSLPIRHPNSKPFDEIISSSELKTALLELSSDNASLIKKIGER